MEIALFEHTKKEDPTAHRAGAPLGTIPPFEGYKTSHGRALRTTEQCFDELAFPPRKYHRGLTSYAQPNTLAEDIAVAKKSSRWTQTTELLPLFVNTLVSGASGGLCSFVVGTTYFSDFPLGGKGFNGMLFIAALGVSAYLIGHSSVQACSGIRNWIRLRSRDAQQPDAALLDAITVCSHPDTTRTHIEKAAHICFKNLHEPGGAIVTAHALSGLYEALRQLGTTKGTFEIYQGLGLACANRYSGLPVQRELVNMFLSEAPKLFKLCEAEEPASNLAASLGQLVIMASKGEEKSRCEALAVELHTLARGIPEVLVGARCELLNTARNIVPKNTPIAENVELQLREVQELKEKVVHYSER